LLRAGTALALASLTVAALAGCGSSSSTEDSATSGSITWWGFSPDTTVADAYIAAFNEEYPDIEVKYNKYEVNAYTAALRAGLVSNNGPDVFNVVAAGPTGPLEQFGDFTLDLTPAMEDLLGADWEEQVSASGVEPLMTDDGALAAASLGYVGAGFLWVNQDLFDEYGQAVPTTYTEWKSACDAFAAGGVDCFGVGAGQPVFNDDTLHAIANSVDPGFWPAAQQGERDWTDPAMIETLEIWKSLEQDGIMQPGALGFQQYPDINNRFLRGEVAMVQMGTWYRQYTTQDGAATALSAAGASGDPFTMIPVPFPDVAEEGNDPTLFVDADYGLAVNNRSAAPKAATTFATWLAASEAGQQIIADKLDLNPALLSVTPDWASITLVNQDVQQPAIEALNAQVAEADEPRYGLESTALAEAIFLASTSVLEGTATPQEAAETLQASAGE
jgi:raffinose/stachyose/melibiose transport system substrate-binding protein